MAVSLTAYNPPAEPDEVSAPSGSGLPEELLQPVIAGAYARGTADAFELLGLAAMFLDREGRVLFSTSSTKSVLNGGITIHAGHLLALARSDNQALAEFATSALRHPSSRPSVTLPACGLTLRALPVGGPVMGGDQLLHLIITVDAAV